MKIESILNIDCSMFSDARATHPTPVNLLELLTNPNPLLIEKQNAIRQASDKEARDKLKRMMPAITPSGVFSERGQDHLINHTGLIAIDIDLKDNQHIPNYNDLKNQLSKLQQIAYCGLSVSGLGYWALIAIAYPDKHKQHFEFLKQYFKSKNISIDPAPASTASLRFYSYDKDAYFNHSAKQLEAYYSPPITAPKKYTPNSFDGSSESVCDQYNQSESFIELLESHGWIKNDKRNKIFFTRPGKTEGISAEFDRSKDPIFFVFSSNAQPFEGGKGYNPFGVYALLEHNGDTKKAAKQLAFNQPKVQRKALASPQVVKRQETPVKRQEVINKVQAIEDPPIERFRRQANKDFDRYFSNKDKNLLKDKYLSNWASSMKKILIESGITEKQFLNK